MQFYHLAVNRKSAEAHIHLGYCYLVGAGGVEVDKATSAAYFKAASLELHDADAQFFLANAYDKGLFGEEDIQGINDEILMMLFNASAAHGNLYALHRLGLIYWDGEFGVEKNEKKALKLLQKAVKEGHQEAQLDLGTAYSFGLAGVKDPEKAIELFRKNAIDGEEGMPMAFFLLGSMYAKGEGVEKDTNEAARLFEKAMSLGVEEAPLALEELHSKGEATMGMTEEMINFYHVFIATFPKGEWLRLRDSDALKVFDAHQVRSFYFIS